MFPKCPVKKVIFLNQHTWNRRRCEMFMLDSIKCIFNYNVSGLKVGYHLVIMSLCLFRHTCSLACTQTCFCIEFFAAQQLSQ